MSIGETMLRACIKHGVSMDALTEISEIAARAELEKSTAPVAEIREAAVTDEMARRVYYSFDGDLRMAEAEQARLYLTAWRAELGPALGLVELKEPTPEECKRICTEYERLLMREGTCGGRDAFDAVRAVMWPKEGL